MKESAGKRSCRTRRTPPGRLLALAACCLLGPAAAALGADWPLFRGNPARTGYAAEQAAPPLAKEWEFQAGAEIVSSPVIFDDVVYVGSRAGKVYALNARTGAQLWQYQAEGWVDAAPAVSGGAVYFPSLGGYLYALDRLTGAQLWRAPLGAPSVSSPLVYGGKVCVGTRAPEKKLKVFDAASGLPLGSFQASQPVDSAVSTDGETLYFGANDGNVYALAGDTLLERWPAHPTPLGGFGAGAVAVSSGSLYALPGCDEKKAFRLSAADGSQQAVSAPLLVSDSWAQFSSPVLAGGKLFVSGGAAEYTAGAVYVQALDDQALSLVWPSSAAIGPVSGLGLLSSPAMAGETLYTGTGDGYLVALSSSGASAAAALDISSPSYASPAVSNGMVVAATLGGKVFGFSAGRAAAFSSPKEGGIVNGTVSIKGYAANPALEGYVVEYSSSEPSSWTAIRSSATAAAVSGAELAAWDTAALPNGPCTLRLRVLDASGAENYAYLRVRVNAPPAPPSSLSAADVSGDTGNKLALGWNASVSGGLAEYRIYRGSGGAFSLLASVGPGATSYVDAAAVTGTTFTYTARAFDGYLESADSNQASAFAVNDDPAADNVPPAAVADLAAVPGTAGGSVRLSWTAPGNDGNLGTASRYEIRYASFSGCAFGGASLWTSTRPASGPAGTPEEEIVSGLFGGVTYYFALEAMDLISTSTPSNVPHASAARDLVPPGPPAGLSVADTQGDHGGSLTLSWGLSPDDGGGAGDVYGYNIYRREQNAAYVLSAPLATRGKGTREYTDTSAEPGHRFYYKVRAFDSTGESAPSPEANGVSADNWRSLDFEQGGTVNLDDGMAVRIPGGAASESDNILVTRLDPVTLQPLFGASAIAGANPTGIVYAVSFERSTTTLRSPARVTLPYTDVAVAGMSVDNLRLYSRSPAGWALLNTSSVDPQAKKVSAEVLRFSTFTIMEFVPSGGLLAGGEVYTYPNPAKGDSLTFKFRVSDKSFVKIDVFNVAGEQVAALEKANCPAGEASEIPWNIKRIASGVYVYRLRAESASGSGTLVKKLAIAH